MVEGVRSNGLKILLAQWLEASHRAKKILYRTKDISIHLLRLYHIFSPSLADALSHKLILFPSWCHSTFGWVPLQKIRSRRVACLASLFGGESAISSHRFCHDPGTTTIFNLRTLNVILYFFLSEWTLKRNRYCQKHVPYLMRT